DYYATPWRGTWAGEAGGAVLGHAIHNHDLMTHFLGPVSALSATVATRVNAIETEDCAAICFEMQGGALVTSSVTLGAASDTTRIRLCFEGFTAESGTEPYAPARAGWQFTARDPGAQSAIDDVLADVGPGRDGYAGFFEAVADALSGTPGQEVTLADGRRSIELVSAIYLAARTGARVALPLGPDSPVYTGWLPQ
ncbi:MAG: Gfo/Idh/MocA family oxidoreductase, partial [Pseudomonadota bacterium]